jgi:hypothetical protein
MTDLLAACARGVVVLLFGMVARADAEPGPMCPEGYMPDPARAGAITEKLAQLEEGRILAERTTTMRVCFGAPATAGMLSGETILLDARLDHAAAAARLGHLVLHAMDRFPGDPPADIRLCSAWLDHVRGTEKRAHALEARLRHAQHLALLPVDLDALVAEYARRCPAAPSPTLP